MSWRYANRIIFENLFSMDFWTAEQAAFAFCDVDFQSFDGWSTYPSSEEHYLRLRIADWRQRCRHALSQGEISNSGHPAAWVDWATAKELKIPADLRATNDAHRRVSNQPETAFQPIKSNALPNGGNKKRPRAESESQRTTRAEEYTQISVYARSHWGSDPTKLPGWDVMARQIVEKKPRITELAQGTIRQFLRGDYEPARKLGIKGPWER